VEDLVRRRGWYVDSGTPALDQAAEAVRTMRALGQEDLLACLDTYAQAAELVAERELAVVAARRDPARMVEAVVVGTVLGEALVDAFRLMAQQSTSARLFAAGK
jgi:hypothetical protein